MLSADDQQALWLSLKLAGVSTTLLLLLGTALALWLEQARGWWVSLVQALIALPLVLPPTVLGFYLLLGFSPTGPIGRFSAALGMPQLSFSFTGLVLASIVYSLPFAVQPLLQSFRTVGKAQLELASSLGAGPFDRFFSVRLPLCKHGYLVAGLLCFAHCLGEFGVALMVGGSIPGETRLLSLQLYDHVESLQWQQAHQLALLLLCGCSLLLWLLLRAQRQAYA